MPKKQHPADARNDEIIDTAVFFISSLFLGRGQYAKAEAKTIAAATAEAERLERENPGSQRALIYAFDAQGRSAICMRMASTTEEPMQKTYAKRFNAQRAAKSAGFSLDDIEIIKTEGGFAWKPKQTTAKAASAPRKPKHPVKRMSKNRHAEASENAEKGILPPAPDFSAHTHARFRGKLAKLIELAEANDIAGLKAVEINPVSTSPKALMRYRDLCITALEAKLSRNP